MHKGNHKTTGDAVSIFKFENTGPACTPEQRNAAKAEFKRLRVLRHPNILKYIDGSDSENLVVIVTESVTPLLELVQVNISGFLTNLLPPK